MGHLILNVDDYEPQRYARTSILQAAGFSVVEAATGREALDLAHLAHPDLVLLDVHLPDIDGLEVCRRLKADSATGNTLVLHVSATFRDARSRTAALNNGADAYLAEAVEPDELVAQVRALLRLADAESQARRAESALRESEARYRRLFEHMTEGFFLAEVICDEAGAPVDYRYLDMNPAFEPLTGVKREAAVGRTVRELLPGVEDSWVQTYGKVALTGVPVAFDEFATPLGRWYSTVAYSPAPGLFACLFRDCTQQKRVEAALRESEETARRRAEELEKLMELVPTAIFVAADPQCRTITGNRTANRFYEAATRENVSAGPVGGAFQDQTRRFFRNGVELGADALPMQLAVATGEEVRNSELDVLLPSGRGISILGSATPLFGTDGRVRGCIGAFLDITERKQAEEALRRALDEACRREAEIEAIYDAAPIGLCIVDCEGRYLRINRRLAQINGLSREAHQGRTFYELVPAIAEQAERLLRHVIETGEPALGVEARGVAPGEPGTERTWVQNWLPVRDVDGKVVGVNVAIQDITARKQVEEDLRRANRIKDEFLATLSHELRTPLTAILGWAHLLERGGLDDDTVRQGIQAIARNADVQRQLVSDVLDVSRMMSGKLRLELADVDLMEVVRLAAASARPALDAKGIQLELDAAATPAIVTADRDRLQQVVWNLLSNAAKFTDRGGRVRVGVHRVDGELQIVVSDTGIGIAASFLPNVFDRFTQADGSISRRHGGLGLGLSIVRQLVELHGGGVSAASDGEGKGATFTVRLPVRQEEEAVRGEAAAPAALTLPVDLHALRVLIVDDLEDTRALLQTVIERAGGRPFLASCAGDALVGLGLTQPNVILADLAMPQMDGYEFLRRLRVLPPEAGGRVPVVAVTAYGSAADREQALAAGFAAHLGKPVLPDELLKVVSEVAGPAIAR